MRSDPELQVARRDGQGMSDKKCFKCGNDRSWELQEYVGIGAVGWVCQTGVGNDGEDSWLNCGA